MILIPAIDLRGGRAVRLRRGDPSEETAYADRPIELAERFPRVHLDTTMAFTSFFEADAPYPTSLFQRLRDVGDRVLLGTDFPNIPYPFAHQLESIEALDLGDDWLRAVCWENGMRLVG